MVQIKTGESSKIFCSPLVGGRDLGMRKSAIHRALCNLLRDVVKRVVLRRNVLDKYLGNINLKLTGALGCA